MEDMDIPTRCQCCGEWFELNEGRGSKMWFPDTVICSDCGEEEQERIEEEEEVAELEEIIANAEADIKVARERLTEIKNQ